MHEGELNRVREDLATMRQALGVRPPFGAAHVWACLCLGLAGIVVAALTAWTGIATMPVEPGSPTHWAYVCLILAPVLSALGAMAAFARRRGDQSPAISRELRYSLVGAAVAVPLFLGFVAWTVKNGQSPATLTAATLFLVGLSLLISSITDRNRWFMLGWAIATMAAGACAPLATYGTAGLLVGGWLAFGGLTTAAVTGWPLRNGAEHASD